jgi:hypothetical protein
VLKTTWNALSDIRLAVLLLMAASATLLTGSFYAEDHVSLFMALNHMRIQDWLPVQWASRPALVWWIPMLFAIMALLGINTFICAANRILRLVGRRRNMARGRFFYLLTPSLVHFLFITIMLGHLATFTMGRWQRVPLTADSPIAVSPEVPACRVAGIRDEFYPESSALGGRLRQTAVTLACPGGQTGGSNMAGRFSSMDVFCSSTKPLKEKRCTINRCPPGLHRPAGRGRLPPKPRKRARVNRC